MSSRVQRSPEVHESLTTLSLSRTSGGLAGALNGKTKALLVADVAELLNISERQVYNLVAAGSIPFFRIRNSIRFDPGAISRWLGEKVENPSREYLSNRKG
jgi:excisionase family DNA binding protein